MQGSVQIELIADDYVPQLSSRSENLKDSFVFVNDVTDELRSNVLDHTRCSGSRDQQFH